LVRLDEGVDAAAVAGGDRQADAAPNAGGQAVAGELLPGVAAVGRAVQATAGAAAGEVPRPPPRLPQGGEQHARVVRVEGDVDGAGVGVLLEDLLPGLAAVGGAVDAALGVGAERLAEDGGEGDVGVLRVDGDLTDLTFLLPDVGPVLTGVGRAVEAVARLDVAADVG